MYQTLSDAELIRKTRERDEMAEETLLERYKPMVLSRARAYYIAGGDLDDLVQEGMIGCYKALLNYDPEKNISFAAFADVCIRRQFCSAVKLSNRKKHFALNNAVSLDGPPDDDAENTMTLLESLEDLRSLNPEQLLIGLEGYNEIASAIDTELSKMEKQVLFLYLRGLSYQKIGDELRRPVKAVDNAIQRVKKKLGKYL